MPQEELMKAHREKYWEELSDGEKIERMRGEVKRLMRSADFLRKVAGNMLAHKHADGEIVVSVNSYIGNESDKSPRDEKYF